jgi:adenylosuccinate lyase
MKLVSHGVSRQEAHEQIRVLSREAVNTVKLGGGKNDLIERIKKSEFFVSQNLTTFIGTWTAKAYVSKEANLG